MAKNEVTTIAITKETKKKLAKRKIHRNQSYDEVLQEMIDETKKNGGES